MNDNNKSVSEGYSLVKKYIIIACRCFSILILLYFFLVSLAYTLQSPLKGGNILEIGINIILILFMMWLIYTISKKTYKIYTGAAAAKFLSIDFIILLLPIIFAMYFIFAVFNSSYFKPIKDNIKARKHIMREIPGIKRIKKTSITDEEKDSIAGNLITLMSNEDPVVREGAVYYLYVFPETNESTEEKIIDNLIKALDDESRAVRSYATLAIGYRGEKAAKAIPYLVEILRKEQALKSPAAEALSKMGSPGIDVLLKISSDTQEKEATRNSAIFSLTKVQIISSRIISTLEEITKEKPASVGYTAEMALERIQSEQERQE